MLEALMVIVAALAVILVVRQTLAWRKFHGPRVIVCPENQKPAGVTVDAGHAAATSVLGAPELRLSACSRWPERAGCGQPCLSQIAASPEDCLVRHIVAQWYQDKTCVYCGRAFGGIDWTEAAPALLSGGAVAEWNQVPAEKLTETLAEAQPVCAACHLAGKMVREHPELVTDRSSRAYPKA
ncbi:MAG TPA: hypothetical protein VMU19_08975 [Bryobacteraceae bacterium]|nr:hypothetical protein [Bryobacteraceae bacterium]